MTNTAASTSTTGRPTGGLGLAYAYLERQLAAGVGPEALTRAALDSDVLRYRYPGPFLANPVFLDADEVANLAADLRTVYDELTGVLDWGFDGDVGRLSAAIGLSSWEQLSLRRALDLGPSTPKPFGRADLMHDANGFALLELNVTTGLGGLENSYLADEMLTHPLLEDFAAEHRLSCVDTTECLLDTLAAGYDDRVAPDGLVALVDWPANFVGQGPAVRQLAALMTDRGQPTVACHVGQLRRRNHRLWVYGHRQPVARVVRFFQLEDICSEAAYAMVAPLFDTLAAGRVQMYAPLDTDLYGSKGVLAMLSARGDDSPAVAAAGRLVPWTRWVTAELDHPVGGVGAALEVASDQQLELVLKPAMASGGSGVVPGWTVSTEVWGAAVSAAVGRPYVLQQRVHPRPEPVLEAVDRPGARYLNWGVFLVDHSIGGHGGFGGCWVRASDRRDVGVLSLERGAQMGCVLVQQAPTSTTQGGR